MSLVLNSAGLPMQAVTTATAGVGNAATFPFGNAPSMTIAPIPTNTRSWMVHPCRIT